MTLLATQASGRSCWLGLRLGGMDWDCQSIARRPRWYARKPRVTLDRRRSSLLDAGIHPVASFLASRIGGFNQISKVSRARWMETIDGVGTPSPLPDAAPIISRFRFLAGRQFAVGDVSLASCER